MGFIAKIFKSIAELIGGIIRAIRDAVKWVLKNVVSKIIPIIGGIVGVGAILNIFGVVSLPAFLKAIGGTVLKIASFTFKTLTGGVKALIGGIKFVGAQVQSFLQIIHFKELLAIHRIAYIFSGEYRKLMNRFYDEISKFSAEVFGNTQTLHYLIQSSRTLIYSLTSAVGYSVDIGEVEFIQTMDTALQKIGDHAERYKDHPELIFDDFAEWVYRPMAKKYGEQNKGFTQILLKTAEAVEKTADTVFQINGQVSQVIGFLPEPLHGTLDDMFGETIRSIEKWRVDEYAPTMTRIDKALNVQKAEQNAINFRLRQLATKMSDPVDLFDDLDRLPELRREVEKRRFGNNINEYEYEDADRFHEDSLSLDELFEKVKTERMKPIEIEKKEYEVQPVVPIKRPGKIPPTKGWQDLGGDY